jgi:hypothetical protein
MVILLLNKLKYYPLALLLIIVLLVDWFIIFIAVPKLLHKTNFGLVAKELPTRLNSSSLIGWVELLKLKI